MGDNQDDAYAGRRAELDRQFRALPRTGTAEYWQAIEGAGAQRAVPLEVLARCLRERCGAKAVAEGQRIFEIMVRRIQRGVDIWAGRIARQARGTGQPQLKEELAQECLLKLWEELTEEGPTFLLENFMHALSRLQQHVAHDMMEKAGEWRRRDTATSTRVPRSEIDSLQAEPAGTDQEPIADRLADPAAERAFERADLSDLWDVVKTLSPGQRELIYDRFWRGLTQEEIAAERNVTPRTVYNRLKATLKQISARYAGEEGDGHGQ